MYLMKLLGITSASASASASASSDNDNCNNITTTPSVDNSNLSDFKTDINLDNVNNVSAATSNAGTRLKPNYNGGYSFSYQACYDEAINSNNHVLASELLVLMVTQLSVFGTCSTRVDI